MSSETPQLAARDLKIAAHGFSPTLNVHVPSLTSRGAEYLQLTEIKTIENFQSSLSAYWEEMGE